MKLNTLIYIICLIMAFVGFIILIVDGCWGDVDTLNFGPTLIIEVITLMIALITMTLDDSGDTIGKILNKNIF